jgi:hypothetical protein
MGKCLLRPYKGATEMGRHNHWKWFDNTNRKWVDSSNRKWFDKKCIFLSKQEMVRHFFLLTGNGSTLFFLLTGNSSTASSSGLRGRTRSCLTILDSSRRPLSHGARRHEATFVIFCHGARSKKSLHC